MTQLLSSYSTSTVPGPCDPDDLIDGIIFAANYLGSTQLLSDKTPSKNIRMMQAQEAVSRIKVSTQHGRCGTRRLTVSVGTETGGVQRCVTTLNGRFLYV